MQATGISGKTCMVTGATSGIGLATAKKLAQAGAQVVLVGRDPARGAEALVHIREGLSEERGEFLQADLARMAEVRRLAREFSQRHQRLDVLVNNVGVFFLTPRLTVEGFEATLAVNYLGVFLLTHLLLGVLRDRAPSRIINVSSDSHRMAKIDFEYLRGGRRYAGNRAYAQTKLAMVMSTYELARRLQGTGITANAVHPGFTATRMFENSGGVVKFFAPVIRLLGKSAEEGADTVFYLASSAEVEGIAGKYFVHRRAVASAACSYDEDAARRLWMLTEEKVGLA